MINNKPSAILEKQSYVERLQRKQFLTIPGNLVAEVTITREVRVRGFPSGRLIQLFRR